MPDPRLNTDVCAHGVNAGSIKGRSQTDRLRKLRGAVADDAMERLAPEVVGRDLETWNRPGLIDQLRGLLCKRHAMHQVDCPFLGR